MVITGGVKENEYSVIYVYGDFGYGATWNEPDKGVAMTETSTGVWVGQAEFCNIMMGNANNYFKFQAGDFSYAPENFDADSPVSLDASTICANNGNSKAFTLPDGTYTFTLKLDKNAESGTFTVSGSSTPVELPVPDALYVIGTVNGETWNPAAGVALTKEDKIFTIDRITVDDAEDGFGFLSFTTILAADWDGDEANPGVNSANRFGAPVNNTMMDELIPGVLTLYAAGVNASAAAAWKVPFGEYSITVNFDTKEVTLDLAAGCLLYTCPSPRDALESRMPSSA